MHGCRFLQWVKSAGALSVRWLGLFLALDPPKFFSRHLLLPGLFKYRRHARVDSGLVHAPLARSLGLRMALARILRDHPFLRRRNMAADLAFGP
jgi:hypothetical protein